MLKRNNTFDLDYGELTGEKSDGNSVTFLNDQNYSSFVSSPLTAKISLSSQDIIDIFSEAIELIQTPGNNKYIQILSSEVEIEFENIPFTSGNINLGYGPNNDPASISVNYQNGSILNDTSSVFRNMIVQNNLTYDPINKSIWIFTDTLPGSTRIVIQDESQVGTFSNGELIIGQVTGATAIIDTTGARGIYNLSDIDGLFENGETFIGDDSGAEAVVGTFECIGDSNFNLYVTYQIVTIT